MIWIKNLLENGWTKEIFFDILFTYKLFVLYNFLKGVYEVKKNLVFVIGMLTMAFGMSAIGCASAPVKKGPFVPLGLTLAEALGKYTAPEEQNWGEDVKVYYLDSFRFEGFRAELDAGGEYTLTGSELTRTRDWHTGKSYARLGVFADGRLRLELLKEDNSTPTYEYKKNKASVAVGPKLAESLGRYLVPIQQTWDNNEQVNVFFLEPLRFEEFKAELDAMAGYYQTRSWNYNRDWETGKTFARWVERANGNFELTLGNRDNSTVNYNYTKGVPRTIRVV
jgi:hypothetical protein